jgi:PAS domain S-box-containing protein
MGEISRSLDGTPDLHNSARAVLETDSFPSEKSERGSLKVLVADDDPVTLESLTGLLTEWGYECVAVRTGSEALELLRASDGPSIAVLDWMLPDVHGPEICKRLRASPSLRYHYLILLTGRDDSTDVVEGLGAGADDYLRNPFDPLELRARLDAGSRIVVQQALRESEQRFQGAFEQAGVGMALVDLSGRWLQVNPAFCDFLGYTSRELIATNVQTVTHPGDLPETLVALQQLVAGTSKIHQTEKRYIHKDGHSVWCLLTASSVTSADGRPSYFVTQIQDISKRKHAEEALREREAQLQLLLNSTAEAIYGLDGDGNCTFSNRACLKLLGYDRAGDLLGKHMHTLLHHSRGDGSPLPDEQCQIYRAFRRGEGAHVDDEVMWKADGSCFPSEYWSYPVWREGKLAGCVVTFVDITSRKLAEDALRAAYAESELFISAVPSILIGTDAQGKITRWNLAATDTFALPASTVRGKSLKDCGIRWISPNIEMEIDSWLRLEKVGRRNDLLFEKDGDQHFLGLSVYRVTFAKEKSAGLLITGLDIAERRHLEEQLRQAQKLEAIGQLAAGIAHEINTPTQYVGDNTTFIKQSWLPISDLARAAQRLDEESRAGGISPEAAARLSHCVKAADLDYVLDEMPKAIDQSLEGVQRVAKIVHAMKEFSHPGSEEKTALDLNRAIETTITVARNEWKYVSEIETCFDPQLPLVHCHAGEFNQVILNLLINAAHAIRQVVGDGVDGKGKIRVATSQDGGWVVISIHDTGCGIPAAIHSRIFEPFFTTKPVGQGTGQGLALAHTTVVRRHGGRLWFETAEGKGTTFVIRIPISPSATEP